LDRTLSVVLPVHNAEATLARQVSELLELLPDLTSRFELLIVDDGSTDHTGEIAHDLARTFPQLHVSRHPRRRGAVAAAMTGLKHTSGEIVFVQDGPNTPTPGELRRLWEMRKEEEPGEVGPPPQPAAGGANLIERLVQWGEAFESAATSR
jgi:glycosyltransferase involved in cell wall biosynthesis